MRRARGSNGESLFKSSEFLTTQQITSYFTTLSAKVRQQTHEVHIAAIEDEINFSAAREHVMATFTIQHPIIFDQYNIGAMAEEDTLKHLKVALLQVICNVSISAFLIHQFVAKLHIYSCLKTPSVDVVAKINKLPPEELTRAQWYCFIIIVIIVATTNSYQNGYIVQRYWFLSGCTLPLTLRAESLSIFLDKSGRGK